MARALSADVYLPPVAYAEPVRYPGGTLEEDLPEGVAARILNPAAWIELPDPVEDEPVYVVGEAGPDLDLEPADPVTDPAPAGLVEPPRGGKGSGEEAWRSYAAALGQVVPEGSSRDEIVEQLIDAGLIEGEG